ncbi:iron-sulfur cluster loop [Methanofollis aquaemaris]|uniref:Iron-sulfur cluster loop n=1 Tax=Methanofollis aquaemaris TaxID=126734 RepID=A0A8A3S2Z3_9EURY|nr:hypothetical protein [Methanofollis aquaemaris]QSZ66121.1 iron-sulfur cluster loop [Methanofollis aquaemaris]
MASSNKELEDFLLSQALELHQRPRVIIEFTKNVGADKIINDIEHFPHFFVLGSIMNQQIVFQRGWIIPYFISELLNGKDFESFLKLDLATTKSIFHEHSLHHFNDKMAFAFHAAIQKIHFEYDNDASNIWTWDEPDCKTVIRRFQEFHRVGQKISTMAVNVLVRDFKLPLPNHRAIDVSGDVHIERVFKRMGLAPRDAKIKEIIEIAQKIYPEYPGFYDSVCWEIGNGWCKPSNPDCEQCPLNGKCPKII